MCRHSSPVPALSSVTTLPPNTVTFTGAPGVGLTPPGGSVTAAGTRGSRAGAWLRPPGSRQARPHCPSAPARLCRRVPPLAWAAGPQRPRAHTGPGMVTARPNGRRRPAAGSAWSMSGEVGWLCVSAGAAARFQERGFLFSLRGCAVVSSRRGRGPPWTGGCPQWDGDGPLGASLSPPTSGVREPAVVVHGDVVAAGPVPRATLRISVRRRQG